MGNYYKIGRYVIELHSNHSLPECHEKWKRYDKSLGEIANILWNYYPNFTVIDIGANVGDSVAIICNKYDVDVLCIEGWSGFVSYLKKNEKLFHSKVDIYDKYLDNNNTLIDALNSFPYYKKSKLIKIDTDGNDFLIINNSIEILKEIEPILFFEYLIKEHTAHLSLMTIENLLKIGYDSFIVYDNYGNLLTTIRENYRMRFEELNNYLLSNIKNGIAVYYLDVCAVKGEKNIIEEIIKFGYDL
jgi:hypothetical protein